MNALLTLEERFCRNINRENDTRCITGWAHMFGLRINRQDKHTGTYVIKQDFDQQGGVSVDIVGFGHLDDLMSTDTPPCWSKSRFIAYVPVCLSCRLMRKPNMCARPVMHLVSFPRLMLRQNRSSRVSSAFISSAHEGQ
eukprot:1195120-Prorocentrum_minimum.AAC.8